MNMAGKRARGFPKTARAAKQRGAETVAAVDFGALSNKKKKEWIRVGPGAVPGTSIICYFNENTGNYDRCVSVPNGQLGKFLKPA
jgi:hypothetical protein